MRAFIIALCGIFILLPKSETLAQCCSAGAPSNANCSLNDGGKNWLKVGVSYNYAFSDTYYNGAKKTNTKYMENYFNFSSLSLAYGLSNKLQLMADLGYFFNKAQRFVTPMVYDRYVSGISDLSLGFSYNTYQSDDKLFNIYQSAKFTLPVGPFKQEYEGVILPIDFQPSSGNNKFNFGLAFSKKFENSNFSLLSYNSFEMSKTIETEFTYHKYGNLYNLSISALYQAMDDFNVSAQARCEIREQALEGNKSEDNKYYYIKASGGLTWYFAPQISYNISGWEASAQYAIPIYKNVNGEQLTNKYSFALNLSKSFNFGSEKFDIKDNLESENFSKIEIKVDGACEMCKARIEGVANELKNVANSDWNDKTKMLTLYYKDSKPDIDQVEQALAKVGHDTEHYKAKNEVYDKLPKCCLYRK